MPFQKDEESNLDLNWTATSFQFDTMMIKLNFLNPVDISPYTT